MKKKVLIVLSCGTDNPNRATRAAFLAVVAHKEGRDATLFLLDDGVYLSKKGVTEHIRAATGDSCDDHMAYLQAQGVPILACKPCVESRQFDEDDLIEGARMATGVELIHLSGDAAVISLQSEAGGEKQLFSATDFSGKTFAFIFGELDRPMSERIQFVDPQSGDLYSLTD